MLGDGLERVPAEAGGVIALGGIHDVDHMMAERGLLARGGLAGADVHAAIDLAGIRVDGLETQRGGQPHGDVGLSHRGGPDEDEERRVRRTFLILQYGSPRLRLRLARLAPLGELHSSISLASPSAAARTPRSARDDCICTLPMHFRSPRLRLRLALPCSAKLFPDFAERQTRHDGPPVGAEVRRARGGEVARARRISLALERRRALMAARQATKDSARSSSGAASSLPGLASSSSSRSMRRRGSRRGEQRGHRADAGRWRRRSPPARSPAARAWGPLARVGRPGRRGSSSGCGKSSSCDGQRRRCRDRPRSRSKSTRSWATCWSTKNTSSSLAATMKVSWSWPTTAPKSSRPKRCGRLAGRGRADWRRARTVMAVTGGPLLAATAGEPAAIRAHARTAPDGRPAWRWTTAAGAKRRLHRDVERLLDESRRAEAHPGLGRVHVDVDLLRRQVDQSTATGNWSRGEQRPVGVEQRLGEERVAHGPAVDDQRDLVAVAARELRRRDEAGHGARPPAASVDARASCPRGRSP